MTSLRSVLKHVLPAHHVLSVRCLFSALSFKLNLISDFRQLFLRAVVRASM